MSFRFILALLAGLVLGVGAAVSASTIMTHVHTRPHNLHDLVHERFKLDSEEKKRLEVSEARYDERRAHIEADIATANRTLAQAIQRDPEVSSTRPGSDAVERSAGELQSVTLDHIFEMRAALKPEHRKAYDAVLVDALTRGS